MLWAVNKAKPGAGKIVSGSMRALLPVLAGVYLLVFMARRGEFRQVYEVSDGTQQGASEPFSCSSGLTVIGCSGVSDRCY